MAAPTYTPPSRDWLPSGLPITYIFASFDGFPLAVRIEVSNNGTDFTAVTVAGVVHLPPDSNGNYFVNVGPYLEAMFSPAVPVLPGVDGNLFKLYRLAAGYLPAFDGVTGEPETTTTAAHALYATELTPIDSGFVTLTRQAIAQSSEYPAVESRASVADGTVSNAIIPYDTENPNPEPCYRYPIELYWLNRAGGWQNWVFDGKHEYGQDIEEPATYTDEYDRLHRASYPGITETVNVFSGFIPSAFYNTVFGILSSIRVYHKQGSEFREVNIDTGSFQRHKEGQRRKQLNFSFAYAETLTVQNA